MASGVLSGPVTPYVFDTNIWVAALRSRRGASFVLLQAINRGLVIGAVSEALFLEYVDVLHRETNLQNFWLGRGEVDIVLAALATHMVPVPIYFTWRPQLADPNDEMVLDCAVNAQAEAIVTFNIQDFLPAARLFGLDVIGPGELVRRYKLVERLAQ
ncbi:MAG TPA: putative toxin-antitoxin system toxin component, PIN family [Nodosilinea sp.]|nr:putative toxin-antitoxin system toxin component, PIN family [Nodosilinea sp.]